MALQQRLCSTVEEDPTFEEYFENGELDKCEVSFIPGTKRSQRLFKTLSSQFSDTILENSGINYNWQIYWPFWATYNSGTRRAKLEFIIGYETETDAKDVYDQIIDSPPGNLQC